MKKISVGQKITTKFEIEAYYSEYGGNPKIVFSPGMIGKIVDVKVPYVRLHTTRENKKVEFFCLVVFLSPATNKMETASIDYCDIEVLDE